MQKNDKYAWLKTFCNERGLSALGTKLLLLLAKMDDKQVDWLKMDEHKARMCVLIDLLIKEGVYPRRKTPAMRKHGWTPYDMCDNYGVLWAFYKGPLKCKHCKKSLRDVKLGPPFKREVGIYDTAQDRTTHYMCPDCKGRIERT